MSSRADQKREAREARERAEREASTRDAHRRRTAILAGGVALNCVGNGKILRDGPFEDGARRVEVGAAEDAVEMALVPLSPEALEDPLQENPLGKLSQFPALHHAGDDRRA